MHLYLRWSCFFLNSIVGVFVVFILIDIFVKRISAKTMPLHFARSFYPHPNWPNIFGIICCLHTVSHFAHANCTLSSNWTSSVHYYYFDAHSVEYIFCSFFTSLSVFFDCELVRLLKNGPCFRPRVPFDCAPFNFGQKMPFGTDKRRSPETV